MERERKDLNRRKRMTRNELENAINAAGNTSIKLTVRAEGCTVRGTLEDVILCRVIMTNKMSCVLVSTKNRTADMLPAGMKPYAIDSYRLAA